MRGFYEKNIKSISIIIGTMIGAGFASGKEVYIFCKIWSSRNIGSCDINNNDGYNNLYDYKNIKAL